ncbi:fusaric acid resistance protein [Robbsia andropogonis]|uniref:Fusaric acid resistance protein n=1 Tax=Robbsia andropogonis TaxID=28092 RepID=A0A0F5K2J1_9BURK|nr:FUSC family protein [Robbsia andropogonis]KKB64346.1 fusaric acid resistance protein [Robbsia andropogonis]MCP1118873.1 FUSC family protein [Robbsia andropogonis]MCP1128340.1 FUSC family protein [Robbsia andropogonis]
MMAPTWKDWLFSIKTFAAAMLALYLALVFELPRPYWAMASVYIVSNPFVGATRSKGLYRGLGTLLGAAGAVLLVPPLVEMPIVLSVAVACWTGLFLFLALQDRTARNYVFMLAGYTLPLIAFPTVENPNTVFDVAVARFEEILLGIVCATVINTTIFPSRLGPSLGERTGAWFNDAIHYMRETLKGRVSGKDLSALRQRLAGSVNGLELLLSQLSYDNTDPGLMTRAKSLRGRMSLLLPIASALGDPLAALRAHGAAPPELEALLIDLVNWLDSNDSAAREAQADALRARLTALEPEYIAVPGMADSQVDGSMRSVSEGLARDAASPEPMAKAAENAERINEDPHHSPHWDRALMSSLLWRLRLLIDLWQDCRTLRELIETEPHCGWVPKLRHWRLGGSERHVDLPMAFLSIFPAVGATIAACMIWIFMGWADGAGAVTLAAVSCSFFAAMDSPAPQVMGFFIWTCVATVLAGVYLFLVLPNVHDFPMLVIMFAGPFICVGTLIPQPRFMLATMLTAVNTATFMSIQSAYDANFLTFINSNSAGCAGLLFAFLFIRITRPFGAELAAARLTRSGWADVVIAASPHAIVAQNNMASRMLDRLMQLLPRLSATDDDHHPSIESFRDLRVGLNTLDLQQIRRTLRDEWRQPIDGVLSGVRQYFQECIQQRRRLPPPPELAARIDAALAANPNVSTRANALDTAHLSDAEQTLGALHALVGLRLSLFPAALAPRAAITIEKSA